MKHVCDSGFRLAKVPRHPLKDPKNGLPSSSPRFLNGANLGGSSVFVFRGSGFRVHVYA